MKVEKIARQMEAWRFGYHTLPSSVGHWIMPLETGDDPTFVLVSPRAGTAHGLGSKAGSVIAYGYWIIRAETGCLYAVPHNEFTKKYRPLEDDQAPPASAPLERHYPGYPPPPEKPEPTPPEGVRLTWLDHTPQFYRH